MIAEAQTEVVIKEKAKILFFQKGVLNATTQEIADEAGVNRALIHYYFRSREHLMDLLLEEIVIAKKNRKRAILLAEVPFRQKIANYIEDALEQGLQYPYLENFIITETARNPEKVNLFCFKDKLRSSELIKDQLEAEIRKGALPPISAEHFMVNLVSMCNYPLLAKNVIRNVHGMSDSTYHQFLLERKEVILKTLFTNPH
ncbi:MAG: TetR/AcrR family transcriptional regulator [Cyclobacteriaceae bacterium]|nr:TetR/AcrR family transcriptional regulator [Cyclobacteriaceae bacterium]